MTTQKQPNDPDQSGPTEGGDHPAGAERPSVASDGSTSGRVISVPVVELEWLRDCSDLQMGDGDTARELAQAWLCQGKSAAQIIVAKETKCR